MGVETLAPTPVTGKKESAGGSCDDGVHPPGSSPDLQQLVTLSCPHLPGLSSSSFLTHPPPRRGSPTQASRPALRGSGEERILSCASLSPVPLPRARVGLTGARGSPARCSGPNRPQNSWRTQGGSGRQHQVFMEIQLSKVSWELGVQGVDWDGGSGRPSQPCHSARLHGNCFVEWMLQMF